MHKQEEKKEEENELVCPFLRTMEKVECEKAGENLQYCICCLLGRILRQLGDK